jgi:hypothetical protein
MMSIVIPTDVKEYIASIADDQRRSDCTELIQLISQITKESPVLWGSIVGFGARHYVYESGREGDTMRIGFASRKAAIVLYGLIQYESGSEHLADLGPHKAGKGCVYITRLAEVNREVLSRMIVEGFRREW